MLYDHVRQLHEQQLWSNLCQLGSAVLAVAANTSSASASSPSSPPFKAADLSTPSTSSSSLPVPNIAPPSSTPGLTPRQKLHVTAMLAEAHLEMREHRRAEALFKEAIQLKKHLGRAKSSSKEAEERAFSDVELKYKLHLCYLATQQPSQAINILQSVPAKQRTPKFNMSLGGLYHRAGMERPAVTCFREVLKSCPLSLEAARMLLQLGAKPKEIQELTLEATASMGAANAEWFHGWVAAHSAMAAREYPTAIAGFRHLEERSPLRREVNLLVSLGQAQYYHGDTSGACTTLQRAHKIDPNNLRGMDALAALLCRERRGRDLEALAGKLIAVSEDAPEPWVAMGYYCYLNKKGSRAVYFAHKACMANQRSVEALLLKGNVLLDLKKLSDATNHFREAMLVAPYRYELHRGLIDCYLAQGRHREASSLAATACKQLSGSPRALTLFATVLARDPYQMSTPRAKGLLEKALQHDSCYLPAVYMLAEILEQESSRDRAIQLLQKQLSMQSTCKLHQMLADLLAKNKDDERAMEHYTLALNLDPKNVSAQEGLQRIEQSQDGGGGGGAGAPASAAAAATTAQAASTAATGSAPAPAAAAAELEQSYDLEMEDDDEDDEEDDEDVGGGNGAVAGGGAAVAEAVEAGAVMDESETEAVWSDGDPSSRYL